MKKVESSISSPTPMLLRYLYRSGAQRRPGTRYRGHWLQLCAAASTSQHQQILASLCIRLPTYYIYNLAARGLLGLLRVTRSIRQGLVAATVAFGVRRAGARPVPFFLYLFGGLGDPQHLLFTIRPRPTCCCALYFYSPIPHRWTQVLTFSSPRTTHFYVLD